MAETSRNSRKALPAHREIEALPMMIVSQILAATENASRMANKEINVF